MDCAVPMLPWRRRRVAEFFEGPVQQAQHGAARLTSEHPDFLGGAPFDMVQIDRLALARAQRGKQSRKVVKRPWRKNGNGHHLDSRRFERVERDHPRSSASINEEISNRRIECGARSRDTIASAEI